MGCQSKGQSMQCSRQTPSNPRVVRVLLSVLLLVNVIVGGLIGYSAYELIQEKHTEGNDTSKLCVRCEDIRLHPDDTWKHVVAYNNDTCCVKPEYASKLVKYFTEHWIKIKQAKENRQFTYCKSSETHSSKPSIKVMGLSQHQEDNGHARLAWNDSHEMAITDHEDILYIAKDKEIRIGKPGLYHVYSQVFFKHNPETMDLNGRPLVFSHTVYLVKPEERGGHSQILYRNMDTPCTADGKVESTTSYLGSVFQLLRGDSLYVKVSRIGHVKPVPHMNMFGAYML